MWRAIPSTARSAAVALAAVVAGCAWVGPETIRSGRPAYNEAILTTSDQQLLQNVVRLRFGDSIGFLNVSSVTANVSLTASGAVNLGFGPSANYQGHLTPFAGTLTAEQNPTISYVPMSGESLLRKFAAQIPLELAILAISGARSHGEAWIAMVRRVNNLRNPDFHDPPMLATDPRFEEVAALSGTLQHRGKLYWVRVTGTPPGHAIVLHSYAPASSREVARLLDLLGVPPPARAGDDIVIPVHLSAGSPGAGAIAIETRSLIDLMRLAAARIELPPDMVGALHLPPVGPAGRAIRILVADQAPAQARVAIEHRGRWFYIADDDDLSKQWFLMLQLLVGAQTPDTGIAPVLTVPVGGR